MGAWEVKLEIMTDRVIGSFTSNKLTNHQRWEERSFTIMTFERQSVFATGFPKKDARFSKSKNILFYSVMMI